MASSSFCRNPIPPALSPATPSPYPLSPLTPLPLLDCPPQGRTSFHSLDGRIRNRPCEARLHARICTVFSKLSDPHLAMLLTRSGAARALRILCPQHLRSEHPKVSKTLGKGGRGELETKPCGIEAVCPGDVDQKTHSRVEKPGWLGTMMKMIGVSSPSFDVRFRLGWRDHPGLDAGAEGGNQKMWAT